MKKEASLISENREKEEEKENREKEERTFYSEIFKTICSTTDGLQH